MQKTVGMEMTKRQVGILTTFYNFDPAYSLTSIVESQLITLVKNGYKTILFTLTNFTGDDKVPAGVEIRKIVPQFLLVDYSGHQAIKEQFYQEVDQATEAFKEHFQDIDVMFAHDIIFQGWFLPYCVALHRVSGQLKTKWYHWTHSAPSMRPAGLETPHNLRYMLPDKSKLVYLNNDHLIKAAEAYSVFPKDVRIIHNPVDPRQFWNLHPLVHQLIEKYDILNAEYVDVYPLSTPRMDSGGKQLDVVIMIMGAIKRLGHTVRLIVCNAHANDVREKSQIAEMISFATLQGLNRNELIFTSLEDVPKYELGVPREVVSQLFHLSNVFIFPSRSENCSLILLEAMLSKNLLILNENCPGLKEFGRDAALYFKFGSNEEQVTYQNREKFMEDVAQIIISEVESSRPLKSFFNAKKLHNYDHIAKQLISLIHEE